MGWRRWGENEEVRGIEVGMWFGIFGHRLWLHRAASRGVGVDGFPHAVLCAFCVPGIDQGNVPFVNLTQDHYWKNYKKE